MPCAAELLDAEGLAQVFLQFAEPLLFASAERSIEVLKSTVRLAEMAWNLPLLPDDPISNQARRNFDEALAAMPAVGARAMRQLIENRANNFGDVRTPLSVTVEGGTLDTVQIVVRRGRPRRSESG